MEPDSLPLASDSYLDEARTLLQAGRFDDALPLLYDLATLHPQNQVIKNLIDRCLYMNQPLIPSAELHKRRNSSGSSLFRRKKIATLSFFAILFVLLAVLFLASAGSFSNNKAPVLTSSSLTATEAPTFTPVPTPTPVPLPNKILLGSDTEPWAEVTRFESDLTLEEMTLHPTILEDLSTFLVAAPGLAQLGNSTNTYKIVFPPSVISKINSGSYDFMKSANVIYPVAINKTTGRIVSLGQVQVPSGSLLLGTGSLGFMLVANLLADQFLPGINQQFEILNQNILDIKTYFFDKEYGIIEGNLKYLGDIRTSLNQRKISPNDLESFRNQLEAVERESRQTLGFLQGQVSRAEDGFNQVKLDKKIFFFRDEDKVREMQKNIDDYQRQSANYLFALQVRGFGSQVRCALPESREMALSRIEDVRNELKTWVRDQENFYSGVEKRIPEMDGLFADSDTARRFNETASTGKAKAKENFDKADKNLVDTTQMVSLMDNIQVSGLVVELDDQGKIKKASRLP